MNRRSFIAVALCCMLATASDVGAQTRAQPPLPTIRLNAGIHVITAEVATDYTTRGTGLMFRERLAPNHGMLFVFEDKWQQCFWMRNTPLPLTIAFIDDDGTIVQLTDMASFDESNHCSQKPVRYALEMEKGWFAKRGLAAGSRLSGLPVRR
jgi:uncharacterized protein